MESPSFGYRHYVPLLKCKRGELQALHDLNPASRDLVTPLFEIPFIDANSKKAPEDQIDATIANASKFLRSGDVVFVDCVLMDRARRYGRQHPIQHVVDSLVRKGIAAVPVVSLSSDRAYIRGVQYCAANHGLGAALRLRDSDFGDRDLDQQIDALLSELDLVVEAVDLIVDFESVGESDEHRTTVAARALVEVLPDLRRWRTLTLASSSYPTALSGVARDKAAVVSRTDWKIWLSLVSDRNLPRLPAFGDYGSDSPGLLAFDPTKMSVGVNLRYSTPDDYVVAKGGSLRKETGEKYRKLAAWLVDQPFFENANTWADQFLLAAASGRGGPGNAETWRRVGTNSHLEVVTNQIASLP